MSNDNLPACPVCGEAPRYTLTFAGNHAFRCDGPIPGDSPRHTIYVLQPELDAARALWTKAVAQQSAPAAPVTDADIDAAIEAIEDSSWDAALEQTLENTKQLLARADGSRAALRTLIARRVQQANAAAEDLARAFTDLHYFAMTAVEVLRVVPEDAERHAEQKFRAASSLERSRLHALDALAAFRKAQGGA